MFLGWRDSKNIPGRMCNLISELVGGLGFTGWPDGEENCARKNWRTSFSRFIPAFISESYNLSVVIRRVLSATGPFQALVNIPVTWSILNIRFPKLFVSNPLVLPPKTTLDHP